MSEVVPVKVQTLEELKAACGAKTRTLHLALKGGAYSLKQVRYRKGRWHIYNAIDNTLQLLDDDGLWSESNIGKWMEGGSLYLVS